MEENLNEESMTAQSHNIDNEFLSVWISFAEIYNEYIYDLLVPKLNVTKGRKKLQLRSFKGNTYIKDLSYINVISGLEAFQVLQYGIQNLNYAATSINNHSSRSHSIFTIKLLQPAATKQGFNVSNFNFCDLAGSERVKKTHNTGERLKESNNINTSLLVLGKCINTIRKSQKNKNIKLIPFRESKLTQLFQKALLGQEKVSMMVNMNPLKNMFDENQHTLNFSAIAKDIIIEQQQPLHHRRSQFLEYMEETVTDFQLVHSNLKSDVELKSQVLFLHNQLSQKKLDYEFNYQRTTESYESMLQRLKKCLENRWQSYQQHLYKLTKQNDIQIHRRNNHASNVIELNSSDEDVIIIDDSSDEEVSCSVDEETLLQNELAKHKEMSETIKTKIEKQESKTLLMQKELEDAKISYKALSNKYLNVINRLNNELELKHQKIKEFQNCILELNV